MKMTMMILGMMFAGIQANAATAPLTYTSTAGTLSGTPGQSQICRISETEVVLIAQGPAIRIPHSIIKQTQWTNEIPNATILESLMNQAAATAMQSTETRLFIGSSSQNYNMAMEDGSIVTILQQSSFQTIRFNPSTAAKEIVALIDLNCK